MHKFAGYTLFLDRDGVLNERLVGDYVVKPEQFVIIDGVLEALKTFSSFFARILVVTNQQGIGKGLMTEEDLSTIHESFLQKVTATGGRIDRVYHCPALEKENSFYRKPNVGMALKAKRDFPEIKFNKAIMVGDSLGDMLFGKRTGMYTVFIGDHSGIPSKYPHLVDYCYPSLAVFADTLKE